MSSPAKVVVAALVAASFLLQGCSTTGESKCPFAKLVKKDTTNTAASQEISAKPDLPQQAR